MQPNSKWIEGLTPTSTVEEAARRSLGPRLMAVAQLLPLAAHFAEHDIEHIHRLRVATRRAGAALKLYRGCLGPKPARRMKKQLRKIRRAAGDARDLDVLAERLARDYGEPVAPVVELIARDRAAVQPTILKAAERCRKKDRFARKSAKLLASIHIPEAKGRTAPDITFHAWATKAFAAVAERFLADMPVENSDVVALHQFRIRAKDLRYVIELAASAFESDLRHPLYSNVEKLQERLGRIQDHVAALHRCAAWMEAAKDEALQETLRELAEAERRGLADAQNDFRSWWTSEREAQVRDSLKTAVIAVDLPAVHQT
jgi:CHAD domain-containing protein